MNQRTLAILCILVILFGVPLAWHRIHVVIPPYWECVDNDGWATETPGCDPCKDHMKVCWDTRKHKLEPDDWQHVTAHYIDKGVMVYEIEDVHDFRECMLAMVKRYCEFIRGGNYVMPAEELR